LDKLSKIFDLIVLDHPWVGFLASTGHILPLNDYLPTEFLADQAANTVGGSHFSYNFDGKQWALAIDAAAPVAAFRSDLLTPNKRPKTWDELIDLAKSGRVLLPGIPLDTLMNFYMLCSTLGEHVCQTRARVVAVEIGVRALQMLRELTTYIVPQFWQLNPIGVYEQMTKTDRFFYCPFAFGYSNYSRPGYAHARLSFGEMVYICKPTPLCTTLGGTGLAVATRCADRDLALKYVSFVANPGTQKTIYVDNGGQPGHRQAWLDDHANAVTCNYFRDTLPALDRAFLRPRYNGGMYFQELAGVPIQKYLREGGSERDVLRRLDELYIASLNYAHGQIEVDPKNWTA
jgi:multiple sugar transport system substrate-binding protein